MSEDEEKKKFQSVIYSVGIIFVLLTITQFVFISQTQSSIISYEDRIDKAYVLRNDLIEILHSYYEVFQEFGNIERTVAYEVENGIITEEQGNNTIRSAIGLYYIPLSLVMNTLLVWDPMFPPSGGFVVDPDYRWMFTEDVIWVGWVPRWYNEIALVDERYTYWTNWENKFFAYSNTEAILTERQVGFTYKTYRDDSLQWSFMDIYISEFDLYIQENFISPKLNLENQLSMVQIASTMTTIGVLLMGFLIDFSKLKEIWRFFYVGFVIITLGLSGLYTILPWF